MYFFMLTIKIKINIKILKNVKPFKKKSPFLFVIFPGTI